MLRFTKVVAVVTALLGVLLSWSAKADESAAAMVADPEFVIPEIKTEAGAVTAHEVVSQVTEEVLVIIRKVQEENADVDEAARALDQLLSQVVDFKFIIRGVMGRQAIKSASKEQLQEFAAKFKEGLINTYANGLKGFTDYQVEVIPPEQSVDGLTELPVSQKIEGPKGVFTATYSMAVSRDQQWVLRNVILNGVNLGSQLRGQFQVSLKKNENNLDKVIAEWGA